VEEAPLISVIDDDRSMRDALTGLVRALGHRAAGFESAEAFLAAPEAGESACIVSDIQLPGMSGLGLRAKLTADGVATPVILITARAELELGARARGAFCMLTKPFPAEAMIACIDRALARRDTSG
jgi:FixJ family two-component response regulator